MTWAEFNLRLLSFNRQEERELYKLRRQAWITYIAPYQDPKKLRGMTEERWWRIGENSKPRVSNEARERFLKEYKKYLDKKEHGRA
jgi:hypothetical protein